MPDFWPWFRTFVVMCSTILASRLIDEWLVKSEPYYFAVALILFCGVFLYLYDLEMRQLK